MQPQNDDDGPGEPGDLLAVFLQELPDGGRRGPEQHENGRKPQHESQRRAEHPPGLLPIGVFHFIERHSGDEGQRRRHDGQNAWRQKRQKTGEQRPAETDIEIHGRFLPCALHGHVPRLKDSPPGAFCHAPRASRPRGAAGNGPEEKFFCSAIQEIYFFLEHMEKIIYKNALMRTDFQTSPLPARSGRKDVMEVMSLPSLGSMSGVSPRMT